MFKQALLALSLFLAASAMAADEPQWLKDARAREAKSLRPSEVRSKDGWFKASLPGKSIGVIEQVEGSYSVELDIGADANVFCEVYPKGIDLANGLRQTFTNSMKNIEESQGKVEARALETSDAGAHGAVPYIALNWVYRVTGEKGAMLGGFKQAVLEKGASAVYCAHNDIGYTKTFAAIHKAFADSLETREPAEPPRYMEIQVGSVQGQKIGLAITTVEIDADGDTKEKESTAMLIAMGKDTIHAQDAVHIEWVRPDGSLINAASTEVVNSEVTTDLGLKLEDGRWLVEGETGGKPFKATLPEDSQPGNSIAHAQQLRALLAQPDPIGREHSINLWVDEMPGTLTAAKTRIVSRQGDRYLARAEVGDMKADLALDKTGVPATAEMKIGPLEIKLERVYVNGSF
jgi:hypothetical protein